MPVGRKIGDELHVVAEGDDGDSILLACGVEEGERGFAYEVNPLLDAARHVQEKNQVEGRGRWLHVAHGALNSVLHDREVLRGESADGPTVTVCDARLNAREARARARAHVEGVRARRQSRLRAALRKRLGVLADESRRDLANRADEFRVAAAYDCARGFGERALAQIRRHFRLVLDAEEHDAARGLKAEPDASVLVRLLVAEATRDLEHAAALRLQLPQLDLAEEARAAERPAEAVAKRVERNVCAYGASVGLGLRLGDVSDEVNRARLRLDEDARARGHAHRQVNALALYLRFAQGHLSPVRGTGRARVFALDLYRDGRAALRDAHVTLPDRQASRRSRSDGDLLQFVVGDDGHAPRTVLHAQFDRA